MKANIAETAAVTDTARLASTYDVEAVRSDFPVLSQTIHDKPLVYLDSGASAQKPRVVIDAVSHYYQRDHANVHRGVHTLSQRATDAYEGARETIRKHLHAESASEIIYVRGTTEGINLVAQSYARPRFKAGDEILVSEMEHHSNIVPWQLVAGQTGATVKKWPIDDNGELLPLSDYLSERVKLVAVTHTSNALGTINPIKEFARQAHSVGAVVVVDGAQAIPHMSIDVQDLDCDFYVFSGHKAYGPTGIGVLFGKQKLLQEMPPYQGGGEMIKQVSFEHTVYHDLPYKFEAGTPAIAQAVGLGVALDYINALGLENIADHERAILEYATALSNETPGMRIIGTAKQKASIVSFELEGIHPHDIGTILDHEGIAVRTGHHCAMPVMLHFDLPATARASFGLYNSCDDVERLFAGIKHVQKVFS